jgi:enolase
MFIRGASCKIIKNSRGEKTLEMTLKTFKGSVWASAPAGKSRGKREVEPWSEQGVEESYRKLQRFCKLIEHKNFMIRQLSDLQMVLDIIKRFEQHMGSLGGNTTYVIETVFLKAAAQDHNRELWQFIHEGMGGGSHVHMPMPVGNCIGGGQHSRLVKGRKPDFQEFLLIPKEKTFGRAVTVNLKAYDEAKHLLKAGSRNDENAWQTDKTNEEVLEVLASIAKKHNLRIGLDVASSTFFSHGKYHYKNKELIRDRVDQVEYLAKLSKKYKLFYLEDPLDEDDFSSFKELLSDVDSKKCMIVGDDLTTTHLADVERAVHAKAINAMIIKPNQVGDMLEVAKVVQYCRKHKITMIFSHRSGDTMDDALADYCVGFGGHFIKCGIYGRERLIKLKRIMDIEKSLN